MKPSRPSLNRWAIRYSASPVGSRLENCRARSIIALYSGWLTTRLRQLVRKPTFSEIDIPLSLKMMTMRSGLRCAMLFSASKLDPEVIAPSPTTAMVHEPSCRMAAPSAMPSAMERPVPACPAARVSCSLSLGSPNPDRPPSRRMFLNSSRRPVTSLCV